MIGPDLRLVDPRATDGAVTGAWAVTQTLWLARLAIVGFTAWIGLILALHVLVPGISHAKRMLSEYTLGEHSYLMQLAFLAIAVGFLALAAGLYRTFRPVPRAISVLLAISGLMAILAMVFRSDSTIAGAQNTLVGYIHTATVVSGIVPIGAAAILMRTAFRSDPLWQPLGRYELGWASAIILATAVHFATFWTDWRGLTQRVDMIITTSWLLLLAIQLHRVADRAEELSTEETLTQAANETPSPSA